MRTTILKSTLDSSQADPLHYSGLQSDPTDDPLDDPFDDSIAMRPADQPLIELIKFPKIANKHLVSS